MPGGRWKPATADFLDAESITCDVFIFEEWLILEASALEESAGLLADGVDSGIPDGREGLAGR